MITSLIEKFERVHLFFFCPAVSAASPMVPGGIRNIHEGKVSGQLANAANHHSDRHGTEDYLNIVQRLGNEVGTTYSRVNILYFNFSSSIRQECTIKQQSRLCE